MRELIERVAKAAEAEMIKQDPAHDWAHIERVRKMALRIAEAESERSRRHINKLIVELAALTHDVGDRKAHGSEEAGRAVLDNLLLTCGVPDAMRPVVSHIASNVSFRGLGVPDEELSLEGKVVQDADRLDAIGAIAIARTFSWGGSKGRVIHDPTVPRFYADNVDDYYRNGGGTSINHFHEKLLHLKDRLHTDAARAIAHGRHARMESYLRWFEAEWSGKS